MVDGRIFHQRIWRRLCSTLIRQLPVPVHRTKDALDVRTRTSCHQLRIKRNNDLEVLAVGLRVAKTKLNRLRQRVHHVATVVVQDQHVCAGVQNRRDVGREVASADWGQNLVGGLPTNGFGGTRSSILPGSSPKCSPPSGDTATIFATALFPGSDQGPRRTYSR